MDVIARFWAKVDKSPGFGPWGDCWIWLASRRHYGHGQFALTHTQPVQAHRFVWTIERGPIPPRMCVLHRCDNPPCVNPAHLYIGTQTDNTADRDARGRGVFPGPTNPARGERNGSAKLTAADVLKIRLALSAGYSQCVIAKKFGVHQTVISAIKRMETWSHV